MTKPTLILLPGLVCDAMVWEKQVQAFSSAYSIIIPDLSHASTPKAMVEAALRDAPPTFSLAGHSMGGWVALMVACAVPQRVLRLALLNTTASADSHEKSQSRLAMIAMVKAGKIDAVVERLLTFNEHSQASKSILRSMFLRNINALIPQQQAMLSRENCEPLLSQITCKTLVISANQDKIFSLSDAMCLHQGIKQSQLVCIEDCGHMSTLDAPLLVNQHLYSLLDDVSPA